MEAHRGRLRVRVQELPFGHPADQRGRQLRTGRVSKAARRWSVVRPVLLLVEDPVQDERSGHRDLQCFGEQVAEEMDGDPAVAQHVREPVVLCRARRTHSTSSKSRVFLVAGGEPLELEVGVGGRMTRRSRPASESMDPMPPS